LEFAITGLPMGMSKNRKGNSTGIGFVRADTVPVDEDELKTLTVLP